VGFNVVLDPSDFHCMDGKKKVFGTFFKISCVTQKKVVHTMSKLKDDGPLILSKLFL